MRAFGERFSAELGEEVVRPAAAQLGGHDGYRARQAIPDAGRVLAAVFAAEIATSRASPAPPNWPAELG
jgi:hypothetical protein